MCKRDNDWLTHFFEDCCEIGESFEAKSGMVYQAYRAFCARTGEFTRSTTEFYNAIEHRGIKKKKTRAGVMLLGLRLVEEEL